MEQSASATVATDTSGDLCASATLDLSCAHGESAGGATHGGNVGGMVQVCR